MWVADLAPTTLVPSSRYAETDPPGRRRLFPGLAAAAALLAILLGLIGTPNALDHQVETARFESLPPLALAVVAALSAIGAPITSVLLAAAACAALLRRRRRVAAGFLAAATAGAAVLYPLLKRLFALPRPDEPLVAASGFGFPSGHTLVATAMWGCLAWILASRTRLTTWRRAASLLCLVLPTGIGLTRIVLRVHWPTDVLGGWLFGVAWLALLLRLEPRPAGPGVGEARRPRP